MKNPVILLHGIFDTSAKMKTMCSFLKSKGFETHCLTLTPSFGHGELDKLAQQINDYIEKTFSSDQKLSIVGFSMGGLVARYYIQRLNGISKIQHFITLGTPHNGSMWAFCVPRKGCFQMRPNSEFIKDLNSDVEILKHIHFTSIWTPYDLMIVPANSSHLKVGNEIKIPVLMHDWLVRDEKVLKSIENLLRN